MKRSRRGDAMEKNTLHQALGPFLIVSQFFGAFPVSGIGPNSKVKLSNFQWCSPLALLTIFFIVYSFLDLVLSGRVIIEYGLKMRTAGPFTFSLICLTAYCIFLQLSRHWPNLMKRIHDVEIIFLHDSYQSPELRKLSQSIRNFGIWFLFWAILEHATYVGSAIYSNHLHIKDCNLTVNFIENYFMRERLQVFSIINFHFWLIPFIEWITIAMTFTWNFVDIFLMLVCMGLATRFRQVLWKLEKHLSESMPCEFWSKMRTDLLALLDLLHQIDQKLSTLILFSCSHNLYFICLQIFNGFLPQANFMKAIYFWFSLIFVLIRFSTTLLSAASINDSANKILSALYEIPTAFWCLELSRFHEIIASGIITLSGKQFFFVTRSLIFAMAGTIVVYELVLIDQVKGADKNALRFHFTSMYASTICCLVHMNY